MKLNGSLRRSSPAVVASHSVAAPPAVAAPVVAPGSRPLAAAPDKALLAKQRTDCPPPAAPSTDELQLIEAAQRGDRKAFQTIVEWHQGAVYGYLRARLMEPADAEDLTQEVFLRSYVGHTRFDRDVIIRAWLLGIARNVLREHSRKIRRRREVAWTELCLQMEDDLIENSSHRYEDVMAHLPACLLSLGPSARQALDLRYQARLRLSAIGEKLHRSEGAVKLLMFRARQALRRCLDDKIRGRGHD